MINTNSTEAKVLRVMKSQLRTANEVIKKSNDKNEKQKAAELIKELEPLIQDFQLIVDNM